MMVSRSVLLRATLGIGISLVAGWILFQSVDVAAALEVLGTANPVFVVLMAVTVFLDVAARGGRWRALLAPIARLRYWRVVGYTYVGYLANNVLPARIGELVRSHALGEGEGVSRPTVLGTVVVERVVDVVFVVALAALAVVVLSVRGAMTSAVLLGAAFVALLVVGLAVAMALDRMPGADRISAVLERWPRVIEMARRLREGLAVASRPGTLLAALVLSALAWGASITTFIAGGQAIGVELSLAQGALLASGVALAMIVPSGPGYLGTFELTAVGIATTFGVDPDDAFAMALLTHAMILGVSSIGGVVAALRLGVGLRIGPETSPETTAPSASPAPHARPDSTLESAPER